MPDPRYLRKDYADAPASNWEQDSKMNMPARNRVQIIITEVMNGWTITQDQHMSLNHGGSIHIAKTPAEVLTVLNSILEKTQ